MIGPFTFWAMASTASKSPSLAIGNPASMTSTPRRASWSAISSFSPTSSEMPGDCSPSRRVVSKIRTWSIGVPSFWWFGVVSANKKPLGPKAREVSASTGGARPYVRSSPAKCDTTVMEATVWQVGAGSVNDRSRPVMREDGAVLKLMRRGALLGLLGGAAFAVYKFLAARSPDTAGVTFQTSPVPSLPRPVPRIDGAPAAPVAPTEVAAPESPERPLVDGSGATPIPEAAFTGAPPWVDPIAGECPVSHPVKAKLTSGIYHLPGGGNYDRTRAERCYVDADAAIADGLRAPKRG